MGRVTPTRRQVLRAVQVVPQGSEQRALRRLDEALQNSRTVGAVIAGKRVVLPRPALEALREAVHGLASGVPVSVAQLEEELSTEDAAQLLGVSRPYVAKLIDDGTLRETRRVGKHRRVLRREVLAHLSRERERQEALLTEMTKDAEERGLYEALEDPFRPKRKR